MHVPEMDSRSCRALASLLLFLATPLSFANTGVLGQTSGLAAPDTPTITSPRGNVSAGFNFVWMQTASNDFVFDYLWTVNVYTDDCQATPITSAILSGNGGTASGNTGARQILSDYTQPVRVPIAASLWWNVITKDSTLPTPQASTASECVPFSVSTTSILSSPPPTTSVPPRSAPPLTMAPPPTAVPANVSLPPRSPPGGSVPPPVGAPRPPPAGPPVLTLVAPRGVVGLDWAFAWSISPLTSDMYKVVYSTYTWSVYTFTDRTCQNVFGQAVGAQSNAVTASLRETTGTFTTAADNTIATNRQYYWRVLVLDADGRDVYQSDSIPCAAFFVSTTLPATASPPPSPVPGVAAPPPSVNSPPPTVALSPPPSVVVVTLVSPRGTVGLDYFFKWSLSNVSTQASFVGYSWTVTTFTNASCSLFDNQNITKRPNTFSQSGSADGSIQTFSFFPANITTNLMLWWGLTALDAQGRPAGTSAQCAQFYVSTLPTVSPASPPGVSSPSPAAAPRPPPSLTLLTLIAPQGTVNLDYSFKWSLSNVVGGNQASFSGYIWTVMTFTDASCSVADNQNITRRPNTFSQSGSADGSIQTFDFFPATNVTTDRTLWWGLTALDAQGRPAAPSVQCAQFYVATLPVVSPSPPPVASPPPGPQPPPIASPPPMLSPPPLPPLAAQPTVLLRFVSRTRQFTQLDDCVSMLTTLRPVYTGNAFGFDCVVGIANISSSAGINTTASTLGLSLSFNSGAMLQVFNNLLTPATGTSQALVWQALFAAVAPGCQSYLAYMGYFSTYRVCASGSTLACALTVPVACLPPPPNTPPPTSPSPPPVATAVCTTSITILSPSGRLPSDSCAGLDAVWGFAAPGAAPLCVESQPNVAVVTGVLTSPQAASLFIALFNSTVVAQHVATVGYSLGCGDSMRFDSVSCTGSSLVWNSSNLAALACLSPPPPSTA